jgi:hypothetical protein
MLNREQLEREAARLLADALSPEGVALEGDARRARLALAVDRALAAIEGADALGTDAIVVVRARRTLARTYAALAEAARHGAGQLSLSAQRAPDCDACEDGWKRVAAIVEECEAFALAATEAARALVEQSPASGAAAQATRAAARARESAGEARDLLRSRNEAFTFHTDEAFSFGEGWHVAAAAVLAGAKVQIEADRHGALHVERFLRAIGVGAQIVTPRPRPRAMKQSTELVARVFAEDPARAQRRLRAAFLGEAPIVEGVLAFLDARGAQRWAHGKKRVALWVRNGTHQPERNTDGAELRALMRLALDAGLEPIIVGEAPPAHTEIEAAIDLSLHRLEPVFRGEDGRRAQLQLFEHLQCAHGLAGQLGVTSAGMDGPALIGLRTAYVTALPNPRMRRWVGTVPGYEELLRDERLFERVSSVFAQWARAAPAGVATAETRPPERGATP